MENKEYFQRSNHDDFKDSYANNANLFSIVMILTFQNVQMKWEYVAISKQFSLLNLLLKVCMRKKFWLIFDIPVWNDRKAIYLKYKQRFIWKWEWYKSNNDFDSLSSKDGNEFKIIDLNLKLLLWHWHSLDTRFYNYPTEIRLHIFHIIGPIQSIW